ncbi:hypothetical protein JNUCC1_02776 [Lentibacillus sp. JNUCC-1]|uniref:general stress protein n=1 Tax=Lentibacillus sp. JNUCC-1 TaxID=2654513 RepID=UPI0012E73C7B|nr:general stress protein [Lentibacillus sp. JNUCC-1]MUV38904.1 hypothetical protein [Lentibacillus sp. JNUCC-1]
MPYEVYGPFESSVEAANIVDNLGLKGLKVENMTVFANEDRSKEMDKLTDVRVEDDGDHSEQKDMMYKLKQMLNNSPDTEEKKSMYEEMLELDLTKEQAQRYTEEVKAGKILVVANPEIRMGQDPAPEYKNLTDPVIEKHE